MCHDDQAVRPPAGCRRVVIPRDECRDRRCELLGECRSVGGGLETDFRVDRQRGQFLARFPSASHQAADFADDARRQGNQIAGRQRARAATRICRDWTKSDWRHDVRGAAGDHDALGESAPKPLLGHLHQAMRFERSQVVVDFLAGNSQACGERRGRGGFDQRRQKLALHGFDRNRRRGRILDDVHVEHAHNQTIDRFLVILDKYILSNDGCAARFPKGHGRETSHRGKEEGHPDLSALDDPARFPNWAGHTSPDYYEHRDVDQARARAVHALERVGLNVMVEAVA